MRVSAGVRHRMRACMSVCEHACAFMVKYLSVHMHEHIQSEVCRVSNNHNMILTACQPHRVTPRQNKRTKKHDNRLHTKHFLPQETKKSTFILKLKHKHKKQLGFLPACGSCRRYRDNGVRGRGKQSVSQQRAILRDKQLLAAIHVHQSGDDVLLLAPFRCSFLTNKQKAST